MPTAVISALSPVPCELMRLLKKIAWVIVLMILVSVIKFVLNQFSPGSFLFHSNLLTSIQLFLFLGLVCWLVLQLLSKLFTKKEFPFWLAWLIVLVMAAAGEWRVYYLMRHADQASKTMHGYLEKYYLMFERQLPEVRKDCACYDDELTYTYLPNASCLHANAEFSDSIHVNSLGLRDDEASLSKPAIICLGDSYTMGSGVPQQQSYPQLLEQKLKLKVLNAGISSYGTARESLLLKRLDTSAVKYIVIQYCLNDIQENNIYVRRDRRRLPIMPKTVYDKAASDHRWATAYYPLKRVLTLSRMVVKDQIALLRGGDPFADRRINYDTAYVPAAARAFLEIVQHSGINFQRVKVLVVDMNRYPGFDHRFTQVAQRIINTGKYSPEFTNSLRFVDISSLNDARYFYPLDKHLNPLGHQVLAGILANNIESLEK